jgi:hypothetical protein
MPLVLLLLLLLVLLLLPYMSHMCLHLRLITLPALSCRSTPSHHDPAISPPMPLHLLLHLLPQPLLLQLPQRLCQPRSPPSLASPWRAQVRSVAARRARWAHRAPWRRRRIHS